MKFSIGIVESNQEINKNILLALLPELLRFMNDAIVKIKQELPSIIKMVITNTAEYNSILNGQLKYELGIPDSDTKLSGLLDIWSKNIVYNYEKPRISGNTIKSSFSANTIRVDFSDVLYTDYALVVDSVRGYSLPWLEWLLLDGNTIIVPKHSVQFGSNKFSRTGNAVMIESKKSWKISSEYAGTINNNWITRALEKAQEPIEDLLKRAFLL